MPVIPHVPLGAIRQPALLHGPDGRIASANDRAEALAGRPLAGRMLAAVVGIFDIRSPDGTPPMPADLPAARALRGEEAVDVPLVVRAADGRTLHVLVTASPIRDEAGVVGALECWQDVSALETAGEELQVQGEELRQQGDELLRASAENDRQRRLLDAVVRTVPSLISLWSVDGRCLWANEATVALAGRARDDLIGRTWQEAGLNPQVLAPIIEEAGVVVATGVPSRNQLKYPSADGPRWLDYEIVPFRNPDGTVAALAIANDITGRKQAEEAVRLHAEELETLMETVPIAVFVSHDPGCRVITGNRAANTLYAAEDGENFSFTPVPGEPLPPRRFFVEGREIPGEELPMQVAAARGVEVRNTELEVLLPGGKTHVVLGSAAPLRRPDGTVRGCLGAFLDISERKRAEEELQQALEHNTAVLESISDSFLALDMDWRFTYSNRRALSYSGKTRADVIGQSIWEIFPEILGTPLETFYRTAMECREPLTYENRSVVATGRSFELRSYPTAGGLSIFGTEITERRRAEEALRESEERLRLAQETAHVAVWDLDVRTGRVTHSPELLRIYGLEADAIDTYDRWQERVHPDDLERVETEREAALAKDEPFDIEFRIVRPSGEVRWVSVIGRGYRDASGEPVRVLGVTRDITDRKTAELALTRTADDLARSNEELQRFAYVASHDLQEPLRSIISFSQLLERRYKGQLDEDADDYIAFIVDGGNRMQRLIRDLLQFSRVETGAKPLKPTDAAEVVASVVRTMESRLAEAGATVTVGELPVVMADEAQLVQVIANLIGNAVKYHRAGVPPEVRIEGRRVGPMVEFSVADNGIGIEPQYFDRIFEMFRRLHTHDQYEGTGIGLAVVKRIVERHGGQIRVESTPGEGSTFLFTLPAA